MTSYIFPEKGGKQWKIGGRTICFFIEQNAIGVVEAALFEDQRNTGLVKFGTVRSWDDIPSFIAECTAVGGMGHMLVDKLIPAAQPIIDNFLRTTLPAESNATPPTVDDMNYVIAEFTEVIPPQAGQQAPQMLVSYLVPAGVSPYPSSVTPASP